MNQVKKDGWRERLYDVIYHSDTPAGRWFDILLIAAIVISVTVVMLDSVDSVSAHHHGLLYGLEWGFTLLFTVEYILRLICTRAPLRYALSFFGVVDLISILPTYLGLFIDGSEYLLVVRSLRIMRVFRILRLMRFVGQAEILLRSLYESRHKVGVFMLFMITIVCIFGSFMYLIEGPDNGFTSIPTSVYWAIVTVTTVGYGDIAPQTPLGRLLASFMVIIGYAIIAVPTGIFTAELSRQIKRPRATSRLDCPVCGHPPCEEDARYCSQCGSELEEPRT